MSSDKTLITTSAAPAALPQFSQAVVHNGTVYCSGSIGINPATGKIVEGSVGDRARQALLNLSAVLEASGSSLNDVLKVNVFLTSMADFGALNAAWDEIFKRENKPARSCVAVHQLPFGTDVEIEMIATVGSKTKAKL